MLTVQPNFTHRTSVRPGFKGLDDEINDGFIDRKKAEYRAQSRECDELIDNEYVPDAMKQGVKGCKAVSEGVFSGWAVAWAVMQVAKFGKKSAAKVADSKITKSIIKTLNPAKEGIAKAFKNINKNISKKYADFTKSDFATKNIIGKGLAKILAGAVKICDSINTKISTFKNNMTFDKVAKATSATVGTGAGIGSAYKSARDEFSKDEDKVKEHNKNVDDNYADEVENFEQRMAEDYE